MKNQITRRDFLKLVGMVPLSFTAPYYLSSLYETPRMEGPKNVIIVVFDAFSAKHISLYGYQRKTMPTLSKLAERAIVYHNHYAGGNYTTPGTASLLTGALPWTHRAFTYRGTVSETYIHKNIFAAFKNYYRIAYTHNPWANHLLLQLRNDLDELIPQSEYLLRSDKVILALFGYDDDIATLSWDLFVKRKYDGYAYSLFSSHLYDIYDKRLDARFSSLESYYPNGLPHFGVDNYYLLENAIDSINDKLENIPKPFMGYFHFLPPHAPYSPHKDFYGRFQNDGWEPINKPTDIFSHGKDNKYLNKARIKYDEFILNVDREFGRFFNRLEMSGLLENTWIVFTSDHGEMFERGIERHGTPVLFEPIIRVPLMIFEPGRKSRLDITTPTSAIDLLPTLLRITGQQNAGWAEGVLLPPYSQVPPNTDRSIYILEAGHNKQYAPLTVATTALIKESYKLMYFSGYEEIGGPDGERIELYDLKNDPEELNNLSSTKPATRDELLNEVKQKLAEVNEPYS